METSEEIAICNAAQEGGACVSYQKSSSYKTRDPNTERLAAKQEDDVIGT